MLFTPIIDEPKREFTPFPKGDYPFNVLSAEQYFSAAGRESIKIKIEALHENRRSFMFVYLQDKKLKGFCEATGLMDQYMTGELNPSDCVNRSGMCHVDIETSEMYGNRNKVIYFKRAKETAQVIDKTPDDLDSGEDLPF